MIQRIKQFVRAVKARLNDDDLNFINAYLNAKEQNLFFAMQIYDQRHVLNVAYTAKKLMQRNHSNVNERLLLRACLLHDVGRTANDIFLLDKIFAVLLDKYLPSVAHKLAKYNKDNTNHCFFSKRRHALFIYYNHADIGALKLKEIGLNDIAKIIKYHHSPQRQDDCQELIILRKADSLN